MSRRVMPKLRVGRKPETTHLKPGTKAMILAAIRMWEIKNGIPHYPSVWGKNRLQAEGYRVSEIAKHFGYSWATTRNAVKRKTWTHLR
jgi:hypothetical protein